MREEIKSFFDLCRLVSGIVVLRFGSKEVIWHESSVFFLFLLRQDFPPCDFPPACGGSAQTLFWEVFDFIIFHCVVKGQFLSCFDWFHSDVIVAFSIIVPYTAVWFTTVVDFAVDSKVKDKSIPVDLATMGWIFLGFILNKAFHGDLSWLEIPDGKDALASTGSIPQFVAPLLLAWIFLNVWHNIYFNNCLMGGDLNPYL